MKKFLVAVVTGLAVSGHLLPDTAAAQTAQTKKNAIPQHATLLNSTSNWLRLRSR